MSSKPPWWQTGVIYELYPRSFQDSNEDGVGDLPGIVRRLDYLQGLGVDAIWLTPIFRSPQRDFGYDMADYYRIHQPFGTMADFDHLLAEAHARGLKVILDLVPNHTSDQHPWFQASRSARDNPRRDWYIWHDPRPNGGPPNNWLSLFGGSAWEFDKLTGQYYLHTFLKEMPDLNWRNPRLKAAMWGVMHSWLARGVDGFRVDVIYALVKDKEFRDDPLNPDYKQGDNPYEQLLHVYSLNRPEAHEVLREMRAVVDSYDGDRVLIGETFHLSSLAEIVSWYGANLDECHLPFNFKLITRPWDARQIRHLVEEYEQMLPIGAWPNWVLGNHDQHRIATRVGGIEQAKLAQMLLLTLRGTPTAYYGDEIGITNGLIPRESVRDPFEKRVQGQGRDPERTPMQWDSSLYAGFSDVEPWLPVAENYQAVNVEVETRDSTSILTLFRALTTLRRANDTLTIGSYSSVEVGHNEVFAYMRKHEETQVLVALNFGSEGQSLDLRGAGVACEVLLSTHLDRSGGEMLDGLYLRPNEGLVARL